MHNLNSGGFCCGRLIISGNVLIAFKANYYWFDYHHFTKPIASITQTMMTLIGLRDPINLF